LAASCSCDCGSDFAFWPLSDIGTACPVYSQTGKREISGPRARNRFDRQLSLDAHQQVRILAGRQASVQIDVDATAAAQAFNGMTYIQNVILNYVTEFITGREGFAGAPVKMVTRAKFNPNLKDRWFHRGNAGDQQYHHVDRNSHRRRAHPRARAGDGSSIFS